MLFVLPLKSHRHSAPRESCILQASFTTISRYLLQKYEKNVDYRSIFLKKLKIIAKKLGTFRNNIYLCTQNNGRVPFIGIGVSPIGRVVRFVATLFLCLLGWIDFETQNSCFKARTCPSSWGTRSSRTRMPQSVKIRYNFSEK